MYYTVVDIKLQHRNSNGDIGDYQQMNAQYVLQVIILILITLTILKKIIQVLLNIKIATRPK